MYRVFFLIFLALCSPSFGKELVTVGVVTDGRSSSSDRTITLVNNEIQVLTTNEFDIRLPKEYQLNGGWKQKGIKTALEDLYQNPKVDMVLVLGYGSAVVAVNRENFPKPTLVATIIDENAANAPVDSDTSGKHNLNYISIQGNLKRELDSFRKVVDFKNIALLSDALISEVTPQLGKKGREEAPKLGVKITSVKHNGGSAKKLLSKIPKNVDAVMIGALSRMSAKQKSKLLKGLIKRGLPSYSMTNSQLVEQGALMTTVPSENSKQIARRIALNLQSTLLGDDLGDMNIFINEPRRLIINMQTAQRLHISPSFKVMLEAEKIHEVKKKASAHWNLKKVANTALSKNLNIKASRLNLSIGREKINESKSRLLPQLSIDATHQFRGGYGADVIGRQNGSASLSFSQIIYDESAWSSLDIERLQQDVRISENRQTELDVIQNATVKFLDVLKAQTLRDVQKENVALSRVNLELAESKVRIGASSKADVYRWESKIFTAKTDLLRAESTLQQSKEALNQILNRPLDEIFDIDPTLVSNPILIMNNPKLAGLIANRKSFYRLSELLIDIGLDASPEIAIALVNIATMQRTHKSEKRSYYIPKASIGGDYSNTYHDSRDNALSMEGENDWYVGVKLSLPLFEGGARSSRVNQSSLKLKQLRFQLKDTKTSIEQKIRANLHTVQASKLSIDLEQASADSAKKNYQLVYDSYSQGTVGVIDLVDAQNSGLTAKFNAVNATYQFLIDLMHLQRSIGNFDFFLTKEERSSMIKEIKKKVSSRR